MNIPILERLGVLGEVERIGVRKLAADFPAANERGFNVFEFSRSLGELPGYAFQVRRSEFDEILFRNTQAANVSTFEDTEVTAVDFQPEGVTVHARASDGAERDVRARYLVDASGRDTLLGANLKLKRRHPVHRSAAVFAHFTSVERR